MYYLFSHSESDCIFWSDDMNPVEDGCELLGQSEYKSKEIARQLYMKNFNPVTMHAALSYFLQAYKD